MNTDETVHVRYMVDDVAAAMDFYTSHFGFEEMSSALPALADVSRGNLRLLLSGPNSSASQILIQDPAGNLVELFQPASR